MNQEVKKINIWDKDNNQFILIFIITLALVYFSPAIIITRISFLLFLLIIYFTKKDYFWFAWLFVVVDAPGHLFCGAAFGDAQRVPLYPIVPGASLSFYDLLVIVYLIKIFTRKRGYGQFTFKSHVRIFVGLILFYLFYSLLAYRLDFVLFYRTITPWLLVYAIILFMQDDETFYRFNKLIFPFVMLAFLAQVFSFIQGEHLVNYLKLGEEFQFKQHLARQIAGGTETPGRNLYSVFITLYSLTLSFVYYSRKNSVFPKKYLVFIIIIAFLSTILTGTRGFMLASSTIILCSILFNAKKLNLVSQNALIVGLFILTLLLFASYSPVIGKQLELVIKRYETLFLLAQGDLTMGGTLHRLTYRIPQIMRWIDQSPFFGFGFSETYYLHADGDIGFHTVILNVGYLGAIALYLLFIAFIVKIYQISSSRLYRAVYQNSGYVFLVGLLGIMVFHLTTNSAFGLTPSASAAMHERYMIYGFILAQFSVTVNALNLSLSQKQIK